MKPQKPWTMTLGQPPHTVRLYERGSRVWVSYQQRGRTKRKTLGWRLRDSDGHVDPRLTERAQAEGSRILHRLILGGGLGTAKGLSMADVIVLVQDEDTGKYPIATPHRRETIQSLIFAKETWGKVLVEDLRPHHFQTLWRTRIRQLTRAGHRGKRGAERTIANVLTVLNWLRDRDLLPADSGRPPSSWKKDLAKDWLTLTAADRNYEPHRPRYTVDEARLLRVAAWEVDPRMGLLIELGAGFRLGQVLRVKRSDLDLERRLLTIPGKGLKSGAMVLLTDGQSEAVEKCLTGYLAALEAGWTRNGRDYQLFPKGRLPKDGVFLADRGPVSRPALYRWLAQMERVAGVAHLDGRSSVGLRRLSVDFALQSHVSLNGLQAVGGWSSPAVPTAVYAAGQQMVAIEEARRIRAEQRGEITDVGTIRVQQQADFVHRANDETA